MNQHEIVEAIQSLKPSKDWWDYASSSITVITSILTLFVALRLFDKFSFKTRVLQKQLDTVFQLITVLQNWTIEISGKGLDETEKTIHGFRIKFFNFKFGKDDENYKILFFKEKLLFTYDWAEQNPLLGWDSNPFLPKLIAEKIALFKITFPYPAYDGNFQKVISIDLDSFDKNIQRKDRVRTNLICNPDDICCRDFETFHMLCNDLIKEIERWLNKYEANELNFK